MSSVAGESAQRPVRLLAFAAVLAWLLAGALVRPLSPDEGQYLAAARFASQGLLPYADFAYLQTPLQPLLFAPLDWLFAGHGFLATRLANALLGFAAVVLVHATARRLGASPRAALAGALLVPACHPFLWAGVGRNDMLPAALLTLGLWLWSASADRWRLLAAGAALSLAAAAKISYALPAAAIAAMLLARPAVGARRAGMWVVLGMALGSVPAAVLALADLRAFLFEAIVFPARAPLLWYREIGEGHRLGAYRFGDLLLASARGPALVAALLVLADLVRRRRPRSPDVGAGVLTAAALAGLVSALLNRPFHPPYLIPALPPLFVLFALALDRMNRPALAWRLALGVSVAIGLAKGVINIARAVDGGAPAALAVGSTSRELGRALADAQVRGPIATLHGEHIVDSGHAIDRRFAAGPFLFRTRGLLTAEEAREWRIVTRETPIGRAEAPGAFVIKLQPGHEPDPDAWLAAQAAALGFVETARVGDFVVCAPAGRRPAAPAASAQALPAARPCGASLADLAARPGG